MLKKADVLDDAGYLFDYIHGTYVNRSRKVIVSLQFTDDLSAEDLQARLAVARETADWQFLFLKPPSPYIRQKLVTDYDGTERAYG
ncbi:MAG: hypothetical protein WDO56_36360 [Gammaproteobacteria bacterium]